ncbi:glycosyltransferase family 2 protein [Microcoleus sp. FACHB-1515]|uniref:glycosyltransferase family 2 protein n=1 Tax=Cyanophyceae TaxID=3028117 RepID=UPI001684344C|nr:glycosyltransferase family A protein [Microcoleus sp. FACHB-1515]MBD2089462.1 glycosyltransferase family 2 protein [Microcoleus sp. FACHB-1515]
MNQPTVYRAAIAPVPTDAPRPLWSVMIPTYHCADYLRQTLASVLAQDLGADVMQIQVVDDHSTLDDPEAAVRELGQGRIEFYRQPQNVGYIRNFETCLERSRGHLVHLLHGDDLVRVGFYQKLQRAFKQHPELGAAYCRHIICDEYGHWQRLSPVEQSQSGILSDALARIVSRHPIQTPSIAVRRSVYEQLGGFDRRMASCGEDWEMWVRIAAHYPVWFEAEPLAIYRSRASSLSGKAMRTGQNLRDVRLATQLIQPYLPAAQAKLLHQQASHLWAFWGLSCARDMLAQGDYSGGLVQIREALCCATSASVIQFLPLVLLAIVSHWNRQLRQAWNQLHCGKTELSRSEEL